MNYVRFLTGNHILNMAILAWFTAQVLKLIIVLIRSRRLDFKRLFGSGGMPSSHSACVTAMAVSVGKVTGIESVAFAIAATIAVVVMYDASNVRKAAGEQAKILNYMMEHWSEQTPALFGRELKELLGHTPVEVFAGALLGCLLGFVF